MATGAGLSKRIMRRELPVVVDLPPNMAGELREYGLMAMTTAWEAVTDSRLNRGGEFMISLEGSAPLEILEALHERRFHTACLPPGKAGWLKRHGLMVMGFSPLAVNKGGIFTLARKGEIYEIEAGGAPLVSGDVVDRHHPAARSIPKRALYSHPVWEIRWVSVSATDADSVCTLIPLDAPVEGVRVY